MKNTTIKFNAAEPMANITTEDEEFWLLIESYGFSPYKIIHGKGGAIISKSFFVDKELIEISKS